MKKLEKFLEAHADFVAMMPRIAERGGPLGQQFLLMMAQQVKHPDLLATLKNFALGQNGTDEMRNRAATLAAEAKLLDKANVTLWVNGTWQTINLMSFEIHTEVAYDHSKPVVQWLKRSTQLLRQHTPEAAKQAEGLLKKQLPPSQRPPTC